MDFEISLKRGRNDSSMSIGPLKSFETKTYTENITYTREVRSADAEPADAEPATDEPAAAEPAEPTAAAEPAGAKPTAGAGSVEPTGDSATESSDDETEMTIELFYDTFVKRTAEQCLLEFQAPQRSAAWLDARRHAITASSFGAASGNNKYSSPKACAIDKLWSTFKGNAMTEYGTYHETDARDSFVFQLNSTLKPTLLDLYGGPYDSFELHECGLIKHHDQPWMAVSPDGLLELKGSKGSVWAVVEYKCPARLRHSTGHPYCTSPHNVPIYYMDQVQGIMGLLNKYPDLLSYVSKTSVSRPEGPKACFFVVWQPLQVHVTRLPFDREYYTKTLEPALEDWFFKRYLPLAVLKHNGALVDGTDTAASCIEL